MADKQIMVNDVNVSGCEHLTEIRGCWLSTCDYLKHKGNITSKVCKYNPNCYFKQLARKTAECEQKEKELKELKRQYKLSCLDCEYKNTKTDADRYREALEEIEELACCIKNFNFGYDELGIGQDITAYAEDILNIINKAKGEVND